MSDSNTLMVLLPGIGQGTKEFTQYGVIDQIKACNSRINITEVDAHFGYYKKETFLARLKEDVINPAMAEGKNHIILLGLSLGGYGSILYSREHPADIQQTLLMAPFVGRKDNLEKYLANSFTEKELKETKSNLRRLREIKLWRWIEQDAADQTNMYAAFGKQDSFSFQHQWFKGVVTKNENGAHIIEGEGKHTWSDWQPLWPQLLNAAGVCTQID